MALSNFISLEETLKHETIGKEEFYAAVTGHNWFNDSTLSFGEIHPFRFNRKNKKQIYKLVEKLRNYYHEAYKPEDFARKYYEYHFDEIDAAKSSKLKEQKRAIADLLAAIVVD